MYASPIEDTLVPGVTVREAGLEPLLVNLGFCPDEESGGAVVVGDERLDMGDEFCDALERGAVERFA